MNGPDMRGWNAQLPDWIEGNLGDADRALLEEALAKDPELRAEAEFVRAVRQSRMEPPAELASSIITRLDQERASLRRRSRFASTWRLSTAAILVLAMGTAVVWRNQFRTIPTASTAPVLTLISDAWLLDDGVVAGGAVLDELSDDELILLLDELEW